MFALLTPQSRFLLDNEVDRAFEGTENDAQESFINRYYWLHYRPLSRDVTHDELRIWAQCWREKKKNKKSFLKKYVNNIEYNR